MNYIWMKIDLKNNEEPLCVARYRSELAERCGVKEKTISESMSRAKKHGWRCCYIKMEDNDE